jgi:hypothetical protein
LRKYSVFIGFTRVAGTVFPVYDRNADGFLRTKNIFSFLGKPLDFARKTVIMKSRNGRKGSVFPWDAELYGSPPAGAPSSNR